MDTDCIYSLNASAVVVFVSGGAFVFVLVFKHIPGKLLCRKTLVNLSVVKNENE
jgi:TRAP-type mannitol/chloroaromatic compound transport system permease large subunit